jgi:hypothetical protein
MATCRAAAAAATAAPLLLALLASCAAPGPSPAAAFSLPDLKAAVLDRVKAKPATAAANEPASADPAAVAAEAFASITGGGGAPPAGAGGATGRPPLVRLLSWQPRAMLWEGFLSPAGAARLGGTLCPWARWYCRAPLLPATPACAAPSRPARRSPPTNPTTLAEADHLIALGAARLTKSDVVDSDTGEIIRSADRTSRCGEGGEVREAQ